MIETESTDCPCGSGAMARIGEERTERLEMVPAQLRVFVTVRPKYACRACGQGVTRAAAHLIEGGLPTEGVIDHMLVSKYADHVPLYVKRPFQAVLDLRRLMGWRVPAPVEV